MNVFIAGRTESIIYLNKSSVIVRGREKAFVVVDTEEKKDEIIALKKQGLIDIFEDENGDNENTIEEETKEENAETKLKASKRGRPKGSKNKTEAKRVAEAEAKTQEMGAEVTISKGNGTIKKKMKNHYNEGQEDSEAVKESIEALKKIEEEEKQPVEKLSDDSVDESERMKREAVVVEDGQSKKKAMGRHIVEEQEEMQEEDPFIDTDKPESDKKEQADIFIDFDGDNDSEDFLGL